MKTLLLTSLCALSSISMLCSCGSMQPDDRLQKVVSGEIFSGQPVDMRQEQRMEAPIREERRTTVPQTYSIDKDTEDTSGRIGLQMPL